MLFFLGSREAPYLPNLVGVSNAHFWALVWLGRVAEVLRLGGCLAVGARVRWAR